MTGDELPASVGPLEAGMIRIMQALATGGRTVAVQMIELMNTADQTVAAAERASLYARRALDGRDEARALVYELLEAVSPQRYLEIRAVAAAWSVELGQPEGIPS